MVVRQMSGPLLFVGADAREFTGFLKHWEIIQKPQISVNWARSGQWKGREVFALANGAGADRAMAAVLIAPKCGAVCNVGFCGALDETMEVGDIVMATQVRSGGSMWAAASPTHAPDCDTGVVLTCERVVQTAKERRELRAMGAAVVEMEAAGVARACEDLEIPFYCIRVVSDLASEDLANDFNAALQMDGTFSIFKLLIGALYDPKVKFGELVRLKERTELASKKLGDFLAACTF
jgi:adenosylhomocysteine nucleosidase